jgi:hypothetical protein
VGVGNVANIPEAHADVILTIEVYSEDGGSMLTYLRNIHNTPHTHTVQRLTSRITLATNHRGNPQSVTNLYVRYLLVDFIECHKANGLAYLDSFCGESFVVIARLLCDGTSLREGREVKGKQDRGLSEPVTSPSEAETSCLQRTEN